MEGIIWLIAIIIIIGNVLKQQSEKKKRDLKNGIPERGGSTRNTVTQPPAANMPHQNRSAQPNVPNQNRSAQPNVPNQNRSAQPNVPNQSRSMQPNVQNRRPPAGNHTYGSENMSRVNDLILMGYQADLTFQRDFVSEGAELLNRFANDQEA